MICLSMAGIIVHYLKENRKSSISIESVSSSFLYCSTNFLLDMIENPPELSFFFVFWVDAAELPAESSVCLIVLRDFLDAPVELYVGGKIYLQCIGDSLISSAS